MTLHPIPLAHFLARRFAISPDLAMLLATLALGEVRA
jgi:hypothetical protein